VPETSRGIFMPPGGLRRLRNSSHMSPSVKMLSVSIRRSNRHPTPAPPRTPTQPYIYVYGMSSHDEINHERPRSQQIRNEKPAYDSQTSG
jgi:hypothetical protein